MAYKIDQYGVMTIFIDTEEERQHINVDIFKMSSKVYVIESKKWYILDGNKEWQPYVPDECTLQAILEVTDDLTAEEQAQLRANIRAASLDDVTSVFHLKGTVDTYNNLPSQDVEIGDVYIVSDENVEYIWSTSESEPDGYWEKLGKNEPDIPAGGTAGQALLKTTNDNYDVSWNTIYQIPSGGTSGQALTKSANTDYSTTWTTINQVPNGGTTGQALRKSSNSDQAVAWQTVNEIPSGGTTGQALTKSSNTNYDAAWTTINQIPSGGSQGQILTKSSATDYDASWQTLNALPTGGTQGQVLAKSSATDYDASWQTLNSLPTGGSQGQVLSKSSSTDYDVAWANGGDADAVHYSADSNKTDVEKAQARANINAEEATTIETISGTTVTITPVNNYIYKCGELASLTISNPPVTGSYEIIFTSGATATSFSIPQTIYMPDSFSIEANMRYEISISDSYGAGMGWSTI